MTQPVIGVTLDSEQPGGYSKLPWYALRQNYCEAVVRAGGLPVLLPHEPEQANGYLDKLDGLIITGADQLSINSAHHQAVREVGAGVAINAVAPDGVIEGIEDPRRRFCLGVQWHPEFAIDPGDAKIFAALIAASQR